MLLLINAVGLTPRLLPLAPRLSQVARAGWVRPLREVLPAVTCTAQATILTGVTADRHGVVANGRLHRDVNEIRLWQQSNSLIEAEPLYATAKKRAAAKGKNFQAAKLFWWFNQGADVAISLTPKPWYGVDGNKVFGVSGSPHGFSEAMVDELGPFPFPAFWGPMSGKASTEWIARAAAVTLDRHHPDLTLVYLPHLDYEPQRRGPSGCDMAKEIEELDAACAPLLDRAQANGAEVWIVSEYGHVDVDTPLFPNRLLRQKGFLEVRDGPFGEQLDLYASRAFALCDHQMAHVYVREERDIPKVADVLRELAGVEELFIGEERAKVHLNCRHSGELILLAKRNCWFAYPFWLDDRQAPDYARCVAIHHKPGFDPCELFFDPKLFAPKLHAARRLVQKKLGFRTRFDVVPLDAQLVRGSHGLPALDPRDAPLLVGQGEPPSSDHLPMTAVRDLLLARLGLA